MISFLCFDLLSMRDSIGSLGRRADEREVKGVTVKNSQLIGTDNGLRIKSFPEKFAGGASEISFNNINMTNVRNPIIIDQEYDCDDICLKKVLIVICTTTKTTFNGKILIIVILIYLFMCSLHW